MLKAKACMLAGDVAGASEALQSLSEDDLKMILLRPCNAASVQTGGADTETVGSMTLETSTFTGGEDGTGGDVLERLLAVQCHYIRGLCLESQQMAYKALSEFVVVTTCYRESPFERIWKTAAFVPFISLCMYRYGVLCLQLAGMRSSELPPNSPEMIKQKLLHDSGVALRMFLIFSTSSDPMKPIGRVRNIVALKRYMQVLEYRFQRVAFNGAFSPDQYQIGSGPASISENRPFVPENLQEDILLCSMLMESYYPVLPEDKIEAQSGAMNSRQKSTAKRLARFGCASLLSEFYESLIERFAATAPLYGNLVLSYLACRDYEKAYIAGHTYHIIGGKDPMVLLSFCNVSLLFNMDKVKNAIGIMEKLLTVESDDGLDMYGRIVETLAKAYLLVAQHLMPERPHEALQMREKTVQLIEEALQVDSQCPSLYLVMGLAYFEIGRLADAEKAVKSALFRDASRADAWHFLALLRTASQDFEGALEICNIQLDLQTHPGINLCLLKTAILSHYDQSEEAIDLAKAIFSYWICKSEGMAAWLGPLTEQSISGQTTGETDASSTMTMNRFKRKFLGRHYKEHQGDLEAGEPTTVLRFSEIANRFPKPPGETKCSLLGLTDLTHFFTCRERLAIHEHIQYTKVHEGGKRFGIAKQLWLWLSKLYLADHSYREAELAAEAAFAVDELDPQVYYRIGRVMEAQGRTDEAIANYEKGVLLDDCHPDCHLALARRYSLSNEPSRLGLAHNHALWVLRTRPSDYRAMNILAEVCVGLGQDEEAGKWFTMALNIQDTAPLLPISPKPFIFMTSH